MNKLNIILSNINFDSTGQLPDRVESITSDSREVESETLFFALKGTQQDGHDYLEEVVRKGASAAVVEDKQSDLDIPQIIVEDSRKALSIAASNYFDHPSKKMQVIGITGTNGKTSTVYLLRNILEKAEIPYGTIGTLGYTIRGEKYKSQLTTPDIIQLKKILNKMVHQGVETVLMEVSSHALAMGRVYNTKFTGACFTNLSEDHLDFHNSMEEYANTKAKLFKMVDTNGFLVCNIDDDYADKFINNAKGKLVTTSLYNSDADYYWSKDTNYHNIIEGKFNLPKDKLNLTSSLSGIFSLKNIASAVALADNLGIDKENISQGVKKTEHIPGRMQEINISEGPRVFVDYAHTPDAVDNVLQELSEIKPDDSQLYVVFGCGGDRERDKRPLMAQAVEKYGDVILLTNDNPRSEDPDQILDDAEQGFSEESTYQKIKDRKKAIFTALEDSNNDDIIAILGKGHENYQIIKGNKYTFNDANVVKKWYTGHEDK